MKEFDDKRKLPAQFQIVAPAVVKLACDVMGFKTQSITHLPQRNQGVARVANNLFPAISQTKRE